MVVAARKLDALTNLELMIKKVIVMMATMMVMMVLGIRKLDMLHAKCHGYAGYIRIKSDLMEKNMIKFLDLLFFLDSMLFTKNLKVEPHFLASAASPVFIIWHQCFGAVEAA